jgi:purine-binding chemotaxis protein CheW
MENSQTNEMSTLFAGFKLGDSHFGIEAHLVQEVVYLGNITHVPDAPAEVIGIRNLRGHIVTVIDFAAHMGIGRVSQSSDNRLLIMVHEGESFGFLVDCVTDVLRLNEIEVQAPPASLSPALAGFVRGIWKNNHQLTALIHPVRLFSYN